MTWSKRAVLAVALAVSVATPALAQVGGRPFEISAGAGIFAFDTRARIQDAATYGASVGLRLTPWIALELPGQIAFSKSLVDGESDHDFVYYGGDLRFNLRPAEGRAVPYLFAGGGYASSKSSVRVPEERTGPAGTMGIGFLHNIAGPRTYLRLQVRDVILRDRTQDLANHFAATAGIHFVLGGKDRDQDLDGVRDWLDKCPNTLIGAKVDLNGCPTDADRDSVWDGLDKCENTPFGCRVDRKTGCPIDTDGDGVCDGIDTCADTPKGATVNATGCPTDNDGDGVWDGIDTCPGTPAGAVVDALGCPKDGDKDGVPDGIDKCPNTEAGLQVDPQGCVIEIVVREIELMDTGMIRLQNVNFETDKSDILPEVKPALDVVGQVLSKWPTLRIEIGGHTDIRGTPKHNQTLSEQRVKSVLDYLLTNFTGLDKKQFVTRGYGLARPIADNKTEAGMAANRRVEFVVLNKGELKKEIERRRLLKKGENAPIETSAPPDTTQ